MGVMTERARNHAALADIVAAGGVVTRKGRREVALVHRPAYGDWTFPKGKLDPGETLEECALREVFEETGFVCELRALLPDVRYEVGRGEKLVRYWRMRVVSGTFAPNDEVDELRWVPVGEAADLLTYDYDMELLEAL
jgi:8-oxo-dGTP diphosphatase